MTERSRGQIPLGRRGVVRVGGTVRRPSGSYPQPVLRLLRHLRTVDREWVPRVQGVDDQGRQLFEWIEGDAGAEPVTPAMASDATLMAIARMLRRLHDATVSFDKSVAGWNELLADPSGSHDVVCHNDVSSYNIVYRGSRPLALVDWEFAHPGSRLWDLAYAAVWLVPLHPPDRCESGGWLGVDQPERLRLFCDGYELGQERTDLLDVIQQRLERNTWQLKLWVEQGVIPPAEDKQDGVAATASYIASQAAKLRRALLA